MITTGIIKNIGISTKNHTANKYKVELNVFQQPGTNDSKTYIVEANACVIGGINAPYAVGDKVYVSFMHEDLSYPIILGRIYQGVSDEARSYAYLDSLAVENDVKLPKSTMIGDISYNKLLYLLKMNATREQNEDDGILLGTDIDDFATKDYVTQLIDEKIETILNTEV